jgi:hypothetical protein
MADFGLSKIIDPDQGDAALRTTCGTPGYMAPGKENTFIYRGCYETWSWKAG